MCIVDVLRRAGAEVTLASIEATRTVRMSRHVQLVADVCLHELSATQSAEFDAIVIPGGMPGSQRLGDCEALRALTVAATHSDQNEPTLKVIAAVCAAPARTLGAWGLLHQKRATAHPSHHALLPPNDDPTFDRAATRVAIDGNIITSQGPGTSLEFALAIVAKLFSPQLAEQLAAQMVVAIPPTPCPPSSS